MSKNPEKSRWSVRSIAICALLTALSVILARLLIPMPNETTRFSIEAVPIFIAGMLFGPLPGAFTGFAADFIGCLFTPYGYNPIFCVPPILYGLCAGLFRPWLTQKISPLRIAAAFLPAIVLGSILYQSGSLALIYGGDSKLAFFVTKLATRSVTLETEEAARTLCITVNPVSAYGWKFDKDEFIDRMRQSVNVPVINVKEELA